MALVVDNSTHLRGRLISENIPLSNQVVMWDAGNERWAYEDIEFEKTVVVEFTYATTSPYTVYSTTTDDIILSTRIHIETPFDDGTSTLSVGHAGDAGALMATTENDPTEEGDYESTRYVEYAGVDSIKLYITPGGSTAGDGSVIIRLAKV